MRKRLSFRCVLALLAAVGLAALFWTLVLAVHQRIAHALKRALPSDPRIRPVLQSGIWTLPEPDPSGNTSSIPRILHQAFSSENVYENYVPLISACLRVNPDWRYYLWRDSDAEALIAKHYPLFLPRYRGYKDNLERADSIRYIILHRFGGIYLDMDVECKRPFFPALSQLPAFLDQERVEQSNIFWSAPFFAMNSAMGSTPGHPFFQFMIEAMRAVAHIGNAFESTGPRLLTAKYTEYSTQSGTRPVAIMEPRVMSPLMDAAKDWKKLCANLWNPTVAHGCSTLASKNWSLDDTDNATLAVHRFLHLGYNFAAKSRGKMVNLTQAFSNRVTFFLSHGSNGTL